MVDGRLSDLRDFYGLLALLADSVGGVRLLSVCSGRQKWPTRGVYFFMENGESRSNSGDGPRIVRIGTHALKEGSRTRLWTRLSQHRGQAATGGGNHRGSIFRLIVGEAMITRHGQGCPTWGVGNNAAAEVRQSELAFEQQVSKVIGAMPFLWLAIEDEPGTNSLRGYIERNAIALLSDFDKEPVDPPSAEWLGLLSNRERVRRSGLWNSNHVDDRYESDFLKCMERLVGDMEKPL